MAESGPTLTAQDLLRHTAFVRNVARCLVADEGHADDVAQDTILVALERTPSVRNPRGWLRRVAERIAWKRVRAEIRRRDREKVTASQVSTPATVDTAARLDLQRKVVEAVLALPEPYQSTVVLRFLDELTPREVARRQQVPLKTVQTRLRRALALLRGHFDGLHRGNRRAWGLALLSLAGLDRRGVATTTARVSSVTGVIAMASKLTFAIGGFICGIGTTVLYTQITDTTRPPARASHRDVSRAALAERRPEGAADAGIATTAPDRDGTAGPAGALSAEEYLRRINEAPAPDGALKVAREITRLPAARGRDIVLTIYAEIVDPSKREQVLRAFSERQGHEFSLDVLDLGARDREPQVQGSAYGWLKQFALRDFQEAPDAYRTWREKYAGLPLGEVLRLNARAFFDRLRGLEGAALERELRFMDGPPNKLVGRCVGVALPTVLEDAGTLEAVERWISPPMPSEEDEPEQFRQQQTIRRAAWAWLEAAEPDEAFLRRVVAPIVRDAPQRHMEQLVFAVLAVGKAKQEWAFEVLLEALQRTPPSALRFNLAMGLAEAGGQRAIPYMIAAIAATNDTEWTAYGLGHYGLRTLTGVQWDKSHDGAWWLAWWDRNSDRLPPEVRALDPRSLVAEFRH